MKTGTDRRRFLLSAGGLSALLATSLNARAEEPAARMPLIEPQQAGAIHRRLLKQTEQLLQGRSVSSAAQLLLADKLTETGALSKTEAASLRDIQTTILETPDLDKIAQVIDRVYETTAKTAGELWIAIVSIARDSVAYAREQLERVGPQRAALIVASDIRGALEGAETGVALGGGMAIVICCIAGAGAASVEKAFENPAVA